MTTHPQVLHWKSLDFLAQYTFSSLEDVTAPTLWYSSSTSMNEIRPCRMFETNWISLTLLTRPGGLPVFGVEIRKAQANFLSNSEPAAFLGLTHSAHSH